MKLFKAMSNTIVNTFALVDNFVAGTNHYVGTYAATGEYLEQVVRHEIKQAQAEAAKELQLISE